MINANKARVHDRPASKRCCCVRRSAVDRTDRPEPTQQTGWTVWRAERSRRHKPGAAKHSSGTEASTNTEMRRGASKKI